MNYQVGVNGLASSLHYPALGYHQTQAVQRPDALSIVLPDLFAFKAVLLNRFRLPHLLRTIGVVNHNQAMSPLVKWHWIVAWLHGMGPSVAFLAPVPYASPILPWELLHEAFRRTIVQAFP